jgi:ribosomal protein L37AE/L43A
MGGPGEEVQMGTAAERFNARFERVGSDEAIAERAEYERRYAAMMERKRGEHDCDENAVPYVSDGALGHGWECGICGAFLQAG